MKSVRRKNKASENNKAEQGRGKGTIRLLVSLRYTSVAFFFSLTPKLRASVKSNKALKQNVAFRYLGLACFTNLGMR